MWSFEFHPVYNQTFFSNSPIHQSPGTIDHHMFVGTSALTDNVDGIPQYAYNIVQGGKNMSLLCTLKNSNGIVMAADSRLLRDGMIVTDNAMKVFHSSNFILGTTGTADVFQKNTECRRIDEVIYDILSSDDYMLPDEFLEALIKEISFSCHSLKDPEYYFVFGYRENGKYLVRSCIVGKNCHRDYDAVISSDVFLRTGYTSLSMEDAKVGIDWDLQKMETVASSTVRCAIEYGNLFESPNPVGGIVHTEHFV